ncbi:MAG: hypothetical protein J6L88_02205 [Clostridia bacterium]|nr:hypothetical protein [Clostridia bacterium]
MQQTINKKALYAAWIALAAFMLITLFCLSRGATGSTAIVQNSVFL